MSLEQRVKELELKRAATIVLSAVGIAVIVIALLIANYPLTAPAVWLPAALVLILAFVFPVPFRNLLGAPEPMSQIPPTPNNVSLTAAPRTIRWLHISDAHIGNRRGASHWWRTRADFTRSVEQMVQRLGAPDLILLTGDLTNRGLRSEFDQLDDLLTQLRGLLSTGGVAPLVVPVPGNHDLQRPSSPDDYQLLRRMQRGRDDPEVRALLDAMWEQEPADTSLLSPMFAEYEAWLERSVLPEYRARADVQFRRSPFPGELWVEFRPKGRFSLGLACLNSAWTHHESGDLKGALHVCVEQLDRALAKPGDDPIAALHTVDRRFVLMHHPPSWLHEKARVSFLQEIFRPDYFDMCLFGHMHKGRANARAVDGGQTRYFSQASSLFGLEHFGTAREERVMGYEWGELTADGEVRVWSLVRQAGNNDVPTFIRDPARMPYEGPLIVRPAGG